MKEKIDLILFDSRIRKTVELLFDCGFDPIQKRISHHPKDPSLPYIQIHCVPSELIDQTLRLVKLLKAQGIKVHPIGSSELGINNVFIQATFDPANNTAIIDLMNLHDELLK